MSSFLGVGRHPRRGSRVWEQLLKNKEEPKLQAGCHTQPAGRTTDCSSCQLLPGNPAPLPYHSQALPAPGAVMLCTSLLFSSDRPALLQPYLIALTPPRNAGNRSLPSPTLSFPASLPSCFPAFLSSPLNNILLLLIFE